MTQWLLHELAFSREFGPAFGDVFGFVTCFATLRWGLPMDDDRYFTLVVAPTAMRGLEASQGPSKGVWSRFQGGLRE